jgi:alpha-methylacyl-CoA racemase
MPHDPPAPAPGAPLEGLRVVEVASVGPVPLAGMLLADLGADVLRIDRVRPSGLGLPLPPRLDITARSRRSVALDLKQPAGRDAALRLIAGADVLLEGLRPGAMEALGLGPDTCAARNPRLVYGRMTGWGQTGPLAPTAGHDLNYIALAGVLSAIGPAETPVPPLNLVGDYGGGTMFLLLGVLAALLERQRSGRGQVVDAAMVDGVATLASLFHGLRAAGQWQGERAANLLDGGAPFYATYRCACGGWLALAALEGRFLAEFLRLAGLPPEWIDAQPDRSAWPAMRQAITQRMGERTRAQWMSVFDGSDACVAPVLGLDEAAAHPHAVARGAYVDVQGVVQPAPAPRFSRSVPRPPGPAPQDGQHTRELLAEAGLAAEEVAALLACGAAMEAPP